MGLAVPINITRRAIEQFVQNGELGHGRIGVVVQELSAPRRLARSRIDEKRRLRGGRADPYLHSLDLSAG